MTTRASAPGKLFLLGEYAVLAGAPAVVLAVNRRARVTVIPRTDDAVLVDAPDIGIRARGHLDRAAAMHWDDPAQAAELRLVTGVIEAVAGAAARAANGVIPGFDARLSTSEFFDPAGPKLGLGSSAALSVALTGALRATASLAPPILAPLVAGHRRAQGGHGSGGDIAAALHGQVVILSAANTDTPAAAQTALPDGLAWGAVYAGKATSTADYLHRLAAWRREHNDEYGRHMRELTEVARGGARAVRDSDTALLLAAVAEYRERLDRFGAATGLDIVGAEHRELGNLAARYGVIYKPSGAGGGDIGIGLARDIDHIHAFRRAAEAAGYRMMEMAIDPDGLSVSSDED